MFDGKTFGHKFTISACDHLNGFAVDAMDFFLPFLVVFLDGFLVALLVGLVDGFGFL